MSADHMHTSSQDAINVSLWSAICLDRRVRPDTVRVTLCLTPDITAEVEALCVNTRLQTVLRLYMCWEHCIQRLCQCQEGPTAHKLPELWQSLRQNLLQRADAGCYRSYDSCTIHQSNSQGNHTMNDCSAAAGPAAQHSKVLQHSGLNNP